ncbi:RES family NAD+ phosphorylase [Nonomuraea roseoviolacea]|uniref:RES family NAD+ phosphorylase n=1 Tax=Nonomuraea roseoviolacea TaxID=103837 RepID=UPI003387C367
MTPRAPRTKSGIQDLRDFPSETVRFGDDFYRAHKSEHDPSYFCNCGKCRFDPPKSAKGRYGTCHTAYSDLVALLEHIGDEKLDMITREWILKRTISRITPTRNFKIADLLARKHVGRWRIDADLQAGTKRSLSKGWGSALQQAGFQGVRHKSRRDAALEELCIAFFGPPGEQPSLLKHESPEPISPHLLRRLANEFGIRVFPQSHLH